MKTYHFSCPLQRYYDAGRGVGRRDPSRRPENIPMLVLLILICWWLM